MINTGRYIIVESDTGNYVGLDYDYYLTDVLSSAIIFKSIEAAEKFIEKRKNDKNSINQFNVNGWTIYTIYIQKV